MLGQLQYLRIIQNIIFGECTRMETGITSDVLFPAQLPNFDSREINLWQDAVCTLQKFPGKWQAKGAPESMCTMHLINPFHAKISF
jgi:hypothetical protein